MTDQYTYAPQLTPRNPAYGGQAPPLPPFDPATHPTAPQKTKRGRIAVTIAGSFAIAVTAGVLGGVIGHHIASTTQATPPVTAPPAPTAAQVHTATVDLCTRFAAGYHAIPETQTSAADVLPSLTYITQALSDDRAADSGIRDAIAESLALARDQASKLTHEPARGAVQPATRWTAEAANDVDQRVWDLCRGYGN